MRNFKKVKLRSPYLSDGEPCGLCTSSTLEPRLRLQSFINLTILTPGGRLGRCILKESEMGPEAKASVCLKGQVITSNSQSLSQSLMHHDRCMIAGGRITGDESYVYRREDILRGPRTGLHL